MTCKKCGKSWTPESFWPTFKNRDGSIALRHKCRECFNKDGLAYWAKRFQENPERWRNQRNAWNAKNRDKVKIFNAKRDYSKYSDKQIAYNAKRRALYEMAGQFSIDDWKQLLELANYACQKCGSRKNYKADKLTPDHIVPLALGGSNHRDNLQVLCGRCNSSKNKRIIDYRPIEMIAEEFVCPN